MRYMVIFGRSILTLLLGENCRGIRRNSCALAIQVVDKLTLYHPYNDGMFAIRFRVC